MPSHRSVFGKRTKIIDQTRVAPMDTCTSRGLVLRTNSCIETRLLLDFMRLASRQRWHAGLSVTAFPHSTRRRMKPEKRTNNRYESYAHAHHPHLLHRHHGGTLLRRRWCSPYTWACKDASYWHSQPRAAHLACDSVHHHEYVFSGVQHPNISRPAFGISAPICARLQYLYIKLSRFNRLHAKFQKNGS